MTLVELTPRGRLTHFITIPPQVEMPAGAVPSPDWAALFSAAGFDPSKWAPAESVWTPPVYSDARAAWTGSLAERPNIPMRIEAAAYRGKPVYFELIGPWTRPERMQLHQWTGAERAFLLTFILFFLAVMIGSAMLARRNLRLGRGDRSGAFRLAAFVFAAWTVAWFFGAHHVPGLHEIAPFIEFLFWGGAFPASRGFYTLLWSRMCAAAGPPRWSPGAGCWQEAFGIRWWDMMCLSVVFRGPL